MVHSHNRPPVLSSEARLCRRPPAVADVRRFSGSSVDADDLVRSIRPAFDAVDALVRTNLGHLTLPCGIGELSRTVLGSLQAVTTTVAATNWARFGVPDTDLESFLQRTCDPVGEGGCATTVAPVVLGAVGGALAGVFEYMMNTADVVDAPALHDFIACFYKTCAIQTGSLLGSTFGRGSRKPGCDSATSMRS